MLSVCLPCDTLAAIPCFYSADHFTPNHHVVKQTNTKFLILRYTKTETGIWISENGFIRGVPMWIVSWFNIFARCTLNWKQLVDIPVFVQASLRVHSRTNGDVCVSALETQVRFVDKRPLVRPAG